MKKLIFQLLILLPVVSMAQKFDWQGHRGARGLLPENSIPAFMKALEIGVNTLEMDVVVTRDYQVVVSHEPWFSPAICLKPDGKQIQADESVNYNIYQLDYEEVKLFDCGSPGNPRFPEQKKMKVHKPLLTDVFRIAEKYCKDERRNEICYNIEIKSNPDWDGIYHPEVKVFCELVYETINAYVPWKRVTIQSFDFRVLRYFHENYPEIRLAALEESEKNPENVLESLGFKPDIYSPYFQLLKPKHVKYLHDENVLIIPWTVNNSIDMKEMISLGVDGIITDYPDLISELQKE